MLTDFEPVATMVKRCFAIDETHVYWTTPTAVLRVKKDGSGPREQIDAGKELGAIAIDATSVFYVSGTSIMKLAK